MTCAGCDARYPIVAGIPDLRLNIPAWVDPEADRRKAASLAERLAGRPAFEFIEHVYRERAGWTEADVKHRTGGVRSALSVLGDELHGWLTTPTADRRFVDLGCGPGQLLAAAARIGRSGIGIDVMLEWLVVARVLILEHGGTPVLAAAMAEALPLPTSSVSGIVSLDVIEHVGDQPQYLREINRILAPGGVVALATPNRFSLSAEPHVNVWGVGWLPRSWQAPYVRWRSGKTYSYTRLLSVPEFRRMVARETTLHAEVIVPRIPDQHLRRFSRGKALLARGFNALLGLTVARKAFQFGGPFFRVIARKGGG